MIDVIQIFKSHQRIKKDKEQTDNLRQFFAGEQTAASKAGYLKDGILHLPHAFNQPDLQQIQTVIIQDPSGIDPFIKEPGKEYYPAEWYKDIKKNHVLSVNRQAVCFCKASPALEFEIFRIEKDGQGNFFNLFLHYTGNAIDIGIPKRNDHKIAELKLNEAVRYCINGKSDFTMSGRKQRTFTEYDYIIEYAGKANEIVFKDLSNIKAEKKIAAAYKLVDERKILK